MDSNAHTGFAPTKGIDLGENGFASSTLVNQNNINIIRQNPGEIILEVTDENFQGTLENIDLQHAGDAMLFRS